MEDNDKDNNNYKVISALELDINMGISRGHQGNQGHKPHLDDNEEEDDEGEDNSKDDNNNKNNKDGRGISAQGIDRELEFFTRTSRTLMVLASMMMIKTRRTTIRMTTTTRTTLMTRVSYLWDYMETWGFRKDIKDIIGIGLND